jgi:hypothetical protein
MPKQRRSPSPVVRVAACATLATLLTVPVFAAPPVAHAAGAVLPPSTELAAPHLKVDIVPLGTPMGPWRLRVENTGSAPVRLIADARLVTMDVEATAQEEDDAQAAAASADPHNAGAMQNGSAARKARRKKGPLVVHCRLPAEMRPVDEDDGRALVVPPGRAYAETFDVRAICFGAALDTLVPGAKVTPHYGWPSRTKTAKSATRAHGKEGFSGPAVVGPVDSASVTASAGAVASVAELDAPSLTLAAPPILDPNMVRPPMPDEDRDGDGVVDNPPKIDRHHHLVLSLPRYVDHESRVDIPAPLTLTNEGDRPRAVFYRASRVRYEVTPPVGERVGCGAPPDETPLREFYTHLRPGQSSHLAMVVSAVCDVDVFARAGVYEVIAHLDESGLAGAQDTLGAFAGVLSTKPMLVRVRRESRHYEEPRPRLE